MSIPLSKKYNQKFHENIPYYYAGTGLSIGAMTSQFLAIYYLNDIDHYIKEKLHCKYYVRYMDDFIIFDMNKERLKEIWKLLKNKLCEEKLELNPKSNIYKLSNGLSFLGYRYRIVDKRLVVSYRSKTKRKIDKKLKYLKQHDMMKYYKTYASYYGYLRKVHHQERSFKMKTREKYEYFKQKKQQSIILIKEGSFYKTYGDDAIILWYLFGYKWLNDTVSFGISPYSKVLDKLKHLGLSYGVIASDEIFVDNDNEVYDLYCRLAKINFRKQKQEDELHLLLDEILIMCDDNYDIVKKIFMNLKGDEKCEKAN